MMVPISQVFFSWDELKPPIMRWFHHRGLPGKDGSIPPGPGSSDGANAAEKGAQVRHLVGDLAERCFSPQFYFRTTPINMKVVSLINHSQLTFLYTHIMLYIYINTPVNIERWMFVLPSIQLTQTPRKQGDGRQFFSTNGSFFGFRFIRLLGDGQTLVITISS